MLLPSCCTLSKLPGSLLGEFETTKFWKQTPLLATDALSLNRQTYSTNDKNYVPLIDKVLHDNNNDRTLIDGPLTIVLMCFNSPNWCRSLFVHPRPYLMLTIGSCFMRSNVAWGTSTLLDEVVVKNTSCLCMFVLLKICIKDCTTKNGERIVLIKLTAKWCEPF